MSPSSRGLGHCPFTAATGVRIPLGTPNERKSLIRKDGAFLFIGFSWDWKTHLRVRQFRMERNWSRVARPEGVRPMEGPKQSPWGYHFALIKKGLHRFGVSLLFCVQGGTAGCFYGHLFQKRSCGYPQCRDQFRLSCE